MHTAAEIRLRALLAADLPAADELRRFARWNQTEADWRGYLAFEPTGCFAAEVGGAVVGTATTVRYEDRLAWIGMVLVHPDWRGRGVGTRLLHHAIDYLKGRQVAGIKLDATAMGRKIYLPLGFSDEYGVTRYEGAAPLKVAGANLATPLARINAVELAKFDAAAFGADRAVVLASLSQRQPEYCFSIAGAGGLRGYLIAREGHEAIQIGPWVADDVSTARSLLHALFQRAPGKKLFLDVPQPNTAAIGLVESSGFTVQRSFMRMHLGSENPDPGIPGRIFGTGGAEKG